MPVHTWLAVNQNEKITTLNCLLLLTALVVCPLHTVTCFRTDVFFSKNTIKFELSCYRKLPKVIMHHVQITRLVIIYTIQIRDDLSVCHTEWLTTVLHLSTPVTLRSVHCEVLNARLVTARLDQFRHETAICCEWYSTFTRPTCVIHLTSAYYDYLDIYCSNLHKARQFTDTTKQTSLVYSTGLHRITQIQFLPN